MGLRTASVRHPHAEVMAPAQTETNPTPTFKLPPENQSASPINSATKHDPSLYIAREASACKSLPATVKKIKTNNANDDVFNGLEIAANENPLRGDTLDEASDTSIAATIAAVTTMTDCPISMGDQQDNKMGLQKVSLDDVNDLLNKHDADVDQILGSLPAGEADEIMQVIKSIGDPACDLGNALPEDLFNVDMMNISMEEQDSVENSEEAQVKFRLSDMYCKQVELEKKLDYLQRRVRKFQMRNIGQHVSGEIAGVFEHVNRTFKHCKDPLLTGEVSTETSSSEMPPECVQHPMSYSSTKNLIKKLELSNATLASRQKKPFGTSDRDGRLSTVAKTASLSQWAPHYKQELQKVSGNLEAELRLVQEEVDSDATVSSSGGESCDETENYNNPHQEYLNIPKRAAWKYLVGRASIASKWTWLQSQVADLEYKVRKRTELHHEIRNSKEPVTLGGDSPSHDTSTTSQVCLNGYRGQLPGASLIRNGESCTTKTDYQCARTRPLMNFRKRKLVQVKGLHLVSKRAARSSTMRCGCISPTMTCMLCTGRLDPTRPRDHSEYLSTNEMLALLDPSYHPVCSLNEAVSASLHVDSVTCTTEWQQRTNMINIKANSKLYLKGERAEKAAVATSAEQVRPRTKNSEHRKKYNRLIKPSTANALTAKIKNRHRGRRQNRHGSVGRTKKRSRMSSAVSSLGSDGNDEELEALGITGSGRFDSPSCSPLLSQTISGYHKQRSRADSYDIDNIIIPYSVAASTRVEKLQYKEILTPKWRIVEDDNSSTTKHDVKTNGIVKTSQNTEDNDKDSFEDLSEAAVFIRHEKSEQDERKKFLSYLKLPIGYGRSRANRRTDSLAESSGANTPDPMSPAPVHVLETAAQPGPPSVPPSASSTDKDKDYSLIISPPATPMPECTPDGPIPTSALRRRTSSQTRPNREGGEMRSNTPEDVEVPPYEKRVFPLQDDLYEKVLGNSTDECHVKANSITQGQDSPPNSPSSAQVCLIPGQVQNHDQQQPTEKDHDSESTESAYGNEDPNDPEWDVEENSKDRFNN